MPSPTSPLPLLGGRLSLDFANATSPNTELSWERLIRFLESTNIVSAERSAQLLSLPQSDLQAADSWGMDRAGKRNPAYHRGA
jgi:hypothetical protein